MRLIDGYKLYDYILDVLAGFGQTVISVNDTLKAIEESDTIDAVEVVRCKDCKFWQKQKDSLQGRCIPSDNYPTGEWYCANGELREGKKWMRRFNNG